jgi:hypothetical protein
MRLSPNTFLTIGCFLLGCTATQARVGETEKQCEERYGKPKEMYDGGAVHLFAKAGMLMLVHFHEAKCDYIIYRKAEEDASGESKELSENERELLLKANGGDREWKVIGSDGVTVVSETDSKELHAQYHITRHSLAIHTREAVKRHQEAKKTEEEKKLKGF